MPPTDPHLSTCDDAERLIADVLLGEPTPETRARLREHLATCPACAEAYADTAALLAATAEPVRPAPPDAFWDDYHAALMRRLAAETPRTTWWGDFRRRADALLDDLAPARTWVPHIALTLALVLFGLYVGRQMGTPGLPADPLPIESPNDPPAPVRQTMLEDRAARYIDRSRVLIMDIANAEEGDEDAFSESLPRRQEVARDLVQEANGLKDDLAEADAEHLRSLVDDLELVLMQIANLDDADGASTVELVRRGVDSKAILLQIVLAEMHWDDDLIGAADGTEPLQ